MRKIILTLAAVAAVGTAAIAPAEARGFRGAGIGLGIGAVAVGAAVAAGAYNNGYYGPGYGYVPDDGYYDNPGYYYDDGPRVYQRRVYRSYDNWRRRIIGNKTTGSGRAFSLFSESRR